jgi:hypothetical protein
MDTIRGKALIIVFGLLIALLSSACGTLQIDTEPTVGPVDETSTQAESAAAVTNQSVQPTPTAMVEVEISTGATTDSAGADQEASVPAAEIQQYTNVDYGFSLSYPADWSVAEANDVDFVGPGSRSVQLSQGTVRLVIGYRRAGETVVISGSGAPAGEFEARGAIQAAGQAVERMVIVYEGKDKVVMYSQVDGLPGMPIATGGLEFTFRLGDFAQVDYGAIELSQSVQEDADFILSSLAIIEVESSGDEAVASAAEYEYSGWQTYTNETVGYTLMAPGQADVMGADRDQAVEFVGPIVGDDHWPWFMVQHFDSAFFRPPAGTSVGQWIADSNIPYKDEAQEMILGGLPAVRLQVAPSQQAYGMDEYYVIAGDQLFKITILHTGGLQDWGLYEQFLASITFTAGNE